MKHLVCLTALVGLGGIVNAQDKSLPAVPPGFKAPEPGEHPRLFFRKADLPALRQRAQTPEGKALIERCKFLLAIKGDPGADDAKLAKYQEGVDRFARKILSEDFGEGGYFGEHAGPGGIASTWTFIPWLQAQRVCAGLDWVTPRPNGEWISLRFVMQTLGAGKGPMYPNPSPQGGCGTDLLTQNGGHHAAYFSSGCGAIRAERKPAMGLQSLRCAARAQDAAQGRRRPSHGTVCVPQPKADITRWA